MNSVASLSCPMEMTMFLGPHPCPRACTGLRNSSNSWGNIWKVAQRTTRMIHWDWKVTSAECLAECLLMKSQLLGRFDDLEAVLKCRISINLVFETTCVLLKSLFGFVNSTFCLMQSPFFFIKPRFWLMIFPCSVGEFILNPFKSQHVFMVSPIFFRKKNSGMLRLGWWTSKLRMHVVSAYLEGCLHSGAPVERPEKWHCWCFGFRCFC